ncbi:MAG: transposase family protein, partial [bacterium]|nr:transposase family protein [bacterium]
EDYAALMRHLEMKPRTIAVGKKEQNGDVEALNGALKRRLEQALLLRGSRDFASVPEYESWLWNIMDKGNALREKRFGEDLAAMTPLKAAPLPEYTSKRTRVSPWSTIRIKHNSYSVPSRLIGEQVDVRVYEDRLQVHYGGVLQARIERLLGRNGHTINYRHIIWSLVKKPGAFERYRYREDLFPSPVFRRAYDLLVQSLATRRKADIEYLRILHLAASTMESDVEAALELLHESAVVPTADCVKALVSPEQPDVPVMRLPDVDLSSFDELLESSMEVAQ